MFMPAYVVPLDREQESDHEHVGMEEECRVRHGWIVPGNIG
jgi:hypothetical protein